MAELQNFVTNPNKRRRANSTTDAEDGADEVGSGLQVSKPPKAIPHLYNNNYTVRLTYADNYRLDIHCDGNSYDNQVWRSNSIFDPDYLIGGHQPLFRDMWASMYDYYAVLACHYTIRCFNTADESVTTTAAPNAQMLQPVNLTLLRTTTAADFTNSAYVWPSAEQKNATTKMLCPRRECEFTGTLTPGDFIIDAKDADSDNTWTAQGSNPAVDRLFGITATPVNFAALAGESEEPYAFILMQVILQYDVQFTQVNPSLRHTSS